MLKLKSRSWIPAVAKAMAGKPDIYGKPIYSSKQYQQLIKFGIPWKFTPPPSKVRGKIYGSPKSKK